MIELQTRTKYAYNAASQLIGLKYGNNVYASYGYSATRLQLNCLDYSTTNRGQTCAHDGTTKFGLTYSFGAAGSNNGLIASITDNVDNGRSTTYTYDSLYRLSTAVTPGSANYGAWGLKETYDRYGNRWSQSAISGCTTQTCPQPSVAVDATTNRITGSPYAYDPNGNMTNDGINTIVYDAENHATSSSGTGGSGTYTTDGNGRRVKKVSGSTATVYIFSGSKVIAEYDNGAAPTSPSREYIYGGSAILAKIDSSGTKYYHQDHLSNRLVTGSTGSTVAQMGHFPFGESWYNSTNDKLYFTTYERDSESGNDYAQARYYVSRLARFSSTDRHSGSIGNPQSLNRFSYALNNPLSYIDPSGMNVCDDTMDETRRRKREKQWHAGGGPLLNFDEEAAEPAQDAGIDCFLGGGDLGNSSEADTGCDISGCTVTVTATPDPIDPPEDDSNSDPELFGDPADPSNRAYNGTLDNLFKTNKNCADILGGKDNALKILNAAKLNATDKKGWQMPTTFAGPYGQDTASKVAENVPGNYAGVDFGTSGVYNQWNGQLFNIFTNANFSALSGSAKLTVKIHEMEHVYLGDTVASHAIDGFGLVGSAPDVQNITKQCQTATLPDPKQGK